MSLSRTAGIAAAALFAVAPAAFAQTPTQSPDTNATQTFTGCLMTERDYRRAHNLGDGQIGGVGLGDEFVLVDVTTSAAKVTADTARSSETPAVATTSAPASTCADRGVAYRLTGSSEEKIKTLVGRQLEIQGRFKHAADAAAGGTQPGEKLPAEVEIVSYIVAPSPAASAPVATPPAATVEPTRPTPPPATVEPPRTSTPPATVDQPRTPATTPAPAERRELPRTASSSGLLVLIGVLALSAAAATTVLRRRTL